MYNVPPFRPTVKYVVFYDHNGCSAYTCGVHGGLTPSALINKKRIIKHSAFWEIWANAHCTHADVALAAPLHAPSNFTWSYPSAKGRAGGRRPFLAKPELCVSDEDLVNDSLVSHSQPSRAPPAPRVRLMEWRGCAKTLCYIPPPVSRGLSAMM